MMRLVLTMALLLFSACSGGNAPANGDGNAPPKCGPRVKKEKSAQDVRDEYIAAGQRLDGEAMVNLMSGKERERAGARVVRGMAEARQDCDSYAIEILDWEQQGEYWVCNTRTTMNLKDGGKHYLPAGNWYVVREGPHWRISLKKP